MLDVWQVSEYLSAKCIFKNSRSRKIQENTHDKVFLLY